MENKYQEALDEVENDLYYHSPKDEVTVKRQDKMIKTLQELVDKETPMKPEWLGGAMTGEPKPYCPKCNYCVNDTYLNKYRCRECNQKLDWE